MSQDRTNAENGNGPSRSHRHIQKDGVRLCARGVSASWCERTLKVCVCVQQCVGLVQHSIVNY